MLSGIVGSNTHRQLDPEEFRGFALVDDWAPVIFVNGADTKAAQIFTLAHELAHVWLGRSGLDDPAQALAVAAQDTSNEFRTPEHDSYIVESWCNEVAAEVLVPIAEISDELDELASITEEFLNGLARRYTVSALVILRCLFDLGKLGRHSYWEWFDHVLERAAQQQRQAPSGGNFYNTYPFRISRRFGRAILEDAFEGGTTYREAAQLLGFRSLGTLDRLAEHLRVQ
jgi:Zn-dependent peptidase ImmA (M78 family)